MGRKDWVLPAHIRVVLCKRQLRWRLGHLDVVPVEGAVNTVLLLFDRHRELLEALALEAAIVQHTRKLAGQRALVPLAREERD